MCTITNQPTTTSEADGITNKHHFYRLKSFIQLYKIILEQQLYEHLAVIQYSAAVGHTGGFGEG